MSDRTDLLKLHDWDELVFGGFYCLHCTPDDELSLDDPIWWPCPPLREVGVTDDEAREIIAAHRAKVADEYRAKLEAEKQEGQRKANEFNARYPVGTPVMAYPSVRPEHPVAVRYQQAVAAGLPRGAESDPCKRLTTRTRSKAWILGHGEPVVMVDGYSSGIALAHVDPITTPEPVR